MDEWQDGLFWVNAANLKMNGVLFILIKNEYFLIFLFCISPNSIISNTIWCVCVCVLNNNLVTLYFAEQEIQCKQPCIL